MIPGYSPNREAIFTMNKKPLPYVTAALLCEKVLIEKNESISIVRIADKIQYRVDIPKTLPQDLMKDVRPMVNVEGLVSIKSGDVTGDHKISVVAERPDGDRKTVFEKVFDFQGKDHGQNIILNMGIGIKDDGIYWFDVLFDDEVLTRVPLVITPLPEPEPKEKETGTK